MPPLFRFNHLKHQRRKKPRGVLRKALRAAATSASHDRVLGTDDGFDHWHQHLDWDGLGNLSPRLRRIFIEGHARLFRYLAQQAHRLGQPYQIWIGLNLNDAGCDAVYMHTANPHTEFPTDLYVGAQWGLPELVDLFSPWLPEFTLIAGRIENALFVYAEGHGLPLRPPA